MRLAVALMLALTLLAPCLADDILVEMEHPAARYPDDGSFAEPIGESFGSKRRVLFKFYPEGAHAVYRFEVEQAGTCAGWLRYGSKGEMALQVAVDPADEAAPEFARATLQPTGGYIGEGVWGWGKIFETDLEAGEHTVAIGSAAIRPDCIWITSGGREPTDEELVETDWREMLGEEVYERAQQPLEEVHPDWLDEIEDYQLPDWYESARVQLHTRLSLRWLDRPEFTGAAEAFARMGTPAFVRHIKSGSEGAWWASAVGAVAPEAEDHNIAQEIIDRAHAAGRRVIVYHRHMEDAQIAETHPDWATRDDRGEIYTRRGPKICFNSPYDDFVLTRLLELVEMGADGLYFDETHQPKAGCWCENCRRQFTEMTGLEHPPYPDASNPVYQRLQDFTNITIERIFRTWRPAIHAANAECVMLIGGNRWPTMCDRHMTHRLWRLADAPKSEFNLPGRMRGWIFSLPKGMAQPVEEIKIAQGHDLHRDAADGRPPHIWIHGLLDEQSALYAAAGMMVHGCVANIDCRENTIPNMEYAAAYDLGNRVSPFFAHRRPVKWAAIHYSELARDRFVGDPEGAWREVLHPVYSAYEALFRERLPVRFITDSQLEQGVPEGYAALFVPAPEHLTDAMREQVDAFAARGGTVIENRGAWVWHTEDGHQPAVEAFLSELPDAPPVQVTGGPNLMHAVTFEGEDGLTVALANEFSWVYTGRKPDEETLAALPDPPAPCEGVTVHLRGIFNAPPRVREVVSGQDLPTRGVNGHIEVDVPAFEHMAVLSVTPEA